MKKKRLSKELIIISVLVLIIFLFTTTGYALYGRVLNLHGTAIFKSNGVVEITSLSMIDSSNVKNNNTTYSGTDVNVDVSFNNRGTNATYYALYQITIENNTFYSYDFTTAHFNSNINYGSNATVSVNYQIEGIAEGETLPSRASKTFTIKVIATISDNHSGDINVNGTIEPDLVQEDIGSVIGRFVGNTAGDLTTEGNLAQFSIEVINSYEYSKTFTFAMASSNSFQIVNCSGGALGNFTLNKNSTQTYQICIKKNAGVTFATSPQNIGIKLTGNNIPDATVGTVSLDVPVDSTIVDDDAPVISNINVTKSSSQGKASISWNGTDDNSIQYYTVLIYKEGDNGYTQIDSKRTQADETTLSLEGLSEGNYYFKVYGIDELGNTATSEEINNPPTTGSSPCLKTENMNFRWIYNITNVLDGLSSNGSSTVAEGATYNATLSTDFARRLPDSIQVKMGNKTLSTSNNEYTYNSSSGAISIPNVTGDITITATGRTCLAKGTKILLADGTYKNIEDITYQDLLAVWSYETGSITYEYPIWIEKEGTTDEYKEITFSDKTKLKVVNNHGIYDANKKEFIETNNLKVGTEVIKIKNGKLTKVTVTDIKTKKEDTTYYHVVSTRYYNIIANDILTTDDAVYLSNLYSFDKKIKFKYRKTVLKDKNNLYTYNELKDTIPYYMYKGLRAGEAKVLVNYQYITTKEFKDYLRYNQMNKDMLLEPVTKNNKRFWMVTTSLDNVTNKDDYLYPEGSTYTLPKSKTKCFYNTSDNKCYKPGERVKVHLGMHFIAK